MAHLPGQVVAIKDDEWGTFCYEPGHDDRKAFKRICNESDSFGSEYYNFCEECWDTYQKALEKKRNDPEQWEHCRECGAKVPELISYRDMDEGMHGPVYEHCESCHVKMNERISREYEQDYGDDDEYW